MKNLFAIVLGFLGALMAAYLAIDFIPGLPNHAIARLIGGIVVGGVIGGLIGAVLGDEMNLQETGALRIGCGIVAGLLGGAVGGTKFTVIEWVQHLLH